MWDKKRFAPVLQAKQLGTGGEVRKPAQKWGPDLGCPPGFPLFPVDFGKNNPQIWEFQFLPERNEL